MSHLFNFNHYFTSVFVRVIRLPSISNSVKSAFMFVAFTIIAMVIGILIVYYKSPQPPGMFLCYIFDNEGTEKPNKIVLFQLLEVF
jgi:hypothetical protein